MMVMIIMVIDYIIIIITHKHKCRLSFCLTKAEKYPEALSAGKKEGVNKIVAKEPARPPDDDDNFHGVMVIMVIMKTISVKGC